MLLLTGVGYCVYPGRCEENVCSVSIHTHTHRHTHMYILLRDKKADILFQLHINGTDPHSLKMSRQGYLTGNYICISLDHLQPDERIHIFNSKCNSLFSFPDLCSFFLSWKYPSLNEITDTHTFSMSQKDLLDWSLLRTWI